LCSRSNHPLCGERRSTALGLRSLITQEMQTALVAVERLVLQGDEGSARWLRA